MAERHYKVEPVDVEGDSFTLEGLQSTLDKIRETWGGKEHKPQSVSPAMSLGNGACVIGVENGRVLLVRDDAARTIAQARAKQDAEPDGRVRNYTAQLVVARIIGPTRAEEVSTVAVAGEGLMGLFFQAAMAVQDVLGDVPECMSLEQCEIRERGFRAQLSRAKTQQRESTFINFPGSNTAQFFELGARPGEYYRVTLAVQIGEAEAPEEIPEVPRRK